MKSDDVKALLAETETAAVAAGEIAERARERALDPALSANDVTSARREMDDAAFRRERLQTAVLRLKDRLKEVRAQEENQRRWIAYEKVKVERDKLAADLKASYPGIESQLGELIAKIATNDREIEYVNSQALPSGAERLRSAELIAREVEAWRVNQTDVIRITRELCLPAFKHDPHKPYMWRHPERQSHAARNGRGRSAACFGGGCFTHRAHSTGDEPVSQDAVIWWAESTDFPTQPFFDRLGASGGAIRLIFRWVSLARHLARTPMPPPKPRANFWKRGCVNTFCDFDAYCDVKLLCSVNLGHPSDLGTNGAKAMKRTFAVFPFSVALIGLGLLVAANASYAATAGNFRCPAPDIGVLVPGTPPVRVPETRRIYELWLDVGDTLQGSEGPLGCPVGLVEEVSVPVWSGVKQRFQRGWILIGRDGSVGSEIVAVRGLNGWTLWWQDADVFGAQLMASDTAPAANRISEAPKAAWSWGGHVVVAPASNDATGW